MVSQLHADFDAMSGRSFRFSTEKTRPPVISVNFSEQRGAVQFFRRPGAISQRVKDADGIELVSASFTSRLISLSLYLTMIIASIR